MKMSPKSLNTFLMLKLPVAWICGVRIKELTKTSCTTSVKYKWINQNPFNSMFWAVQGMAAELSTGALIMDQINEQKVKISMLVANNKANFSKKATGRINFICTEGSKIVEALENALQTGEGQTFWMRSIGTNENGIVVSTFDFEWTLKVKTEKRVENSK
ncbi:MAG: DUF4442 domain-containing protein [Leeuwenhoekiella sp.]